MRFFARRLLFLGAVLAALAMLMTPSLAGADDDDDDGGGGGDRAFCAPDGALQLEQCGVLGLLDFDFDASSGPLSENPTGTFFFQAVPHRFEGQVTCLQVTGNRAAIGGLVTAHTSPAGPFLLGRGFAFTVLDNSPLAADRISRPAGLLDIFLPTAPAANTPNCGNLFEPTREVIGDIVVQDNIAGGGGDDDEDDDDDDDDEDNDDDDDDEDDG